MMVPKNITINKVQYSEAALIKAAREKRKNAETDWQGSFWRFILQWTNDESHILVHTSGSTGLPKEMEISKVAMLKSASLTCEFFQLDASKTALLCMSAKHIGGMMMIVRCFYSGMELLVQTPSSNPLKDLNYPVDFAAMVPYQVQNMLLHSSDELHKLNTLIVGGGAISSNLEQALSNTNLKAYHTFGMTETVSHFALRQIGKESTFSCLKDISVESDKLGRLIVLAPAFHAEPLVTNDLVEIIDKTSFKWLGRSDNAFESGGFKFIPEVLEEKLRAVYDQNLIVTSIPDGSLNNAAVLLVEGKEQDFDAGKLAIVLSKYEQPKKIWFVPHFVNTSNGKWQRQHTLDMALKTNT